MLKSTMVAPDVVKVYEVEEETFRNKLYTIATDTLAPVRRYFWNLPAPRPLRTSYFIYADQKLHEVPRGKETVEPLEPALIQEPVFQELITLFNFELQDKLNLRLEDLELKVRQIRVLATAAIGAANFFPDKIHRDGALAVGLVIIDRHGVRGGETQLFDNQFAPPFWRRVLRSGDFLLFNDELLWHHTTSVEPVASQIGYRDIFVFEAKKRVIT